MLRFKWFNRKKSIDLGQIVKPTFINADLIISFCEEKQRMCDTDLMGIGRFAALEDVIYYIKMLPVNKKIK
jgi:hypothetical protein